MAGADTAEEKKEVDWVFVIVEGSNAKIGLGQSQQDSPVCGKNEALVNAYDKIFGLALFPIELANCFETFFLWSS